MPQTIPTTAEDIGNETMGRVPAISVKETTGLIGSPDHVFVDLRSGSEQARTVFCRAGGKQPRARWSRIWTV